MNKSLNEIAQITMGQSPKSSAYNEDGNGLPFLQGRTTFGRMYPSFDTWTTEWNKECDADDILFTVRAPVGDVNIAQTKIALGRGVAGIRAKNVLPKYLYYLLYANKSTFIASSSGTIYDSINKDQLDNVKLKVHNDEEQRHIVDTIGSVDNLIENNNKKIQLLITFGEQLYDKILLTNNYKKTQLNNLVSIYRGASPRPIQNYVADEGIPWVKISDATSISNPFLFETKEFINAEGVKHSFEVYPNDFILSNSATPGLPIFMQITACVHDGWLIIRNFKKISPEYLYWVLKKDRNHLLSLGNGSIFTNLKTEILKTHEVPVFDDTTMESINAKFKEIVNTMKNLVENNNKLNNIKNILLKKYFG